MGRLLKGPQNKSWVVDKSRPKFRWFVSRHRRQRVHCDNSDGPQRCVCVCVSCVSGTLVPGEGSRCVRRRETPYYERLPRYDLRFTNFW